MIASSEQAGQKAAPDGNTAENSPASGACAGRRPARFPLGEEVSGYDRIWCRARRRQFLSFRISGPLNMIVKCALAGVALLPVWHVPPDALDAMPLESNAYTPCPVVPAYEPVLLPARIL